jgi:TPR repeat protein
MEMLGYCYENGYGVAEDLEQAIHWYQQAAERGDEEAKASLERLAVEREAEIRTNN